MDAWIFQVSVFICGRCLCKLKPCMKPIIGQNYCVQSAGSSVQRTKSNNNKKLLRQGNTSYQDCYHVLHIKLRNNICVFNSNLNCRNLADCAEPGRSQMCCKAYLYLLKEMLHWHRDSSSLHSGRGKDLCTDMRSEETGKSQKEVGGGILEEESAVPRTVGEQ